MKELHQETYNTAVQEAPSPVESIETVSFAPDEERLDEVSNETVAKDGPDSDTACDAPHEDCAEDEEYIAPPRIDLDSLQESDFIDTEEADTDESWNQEEEPTLVYDVPRPALTIDEAATILGKSVRAVERGISGKWGNRLPEGWKARKMKIDGQDEWRIIPPPSFRIRHSKTRTPRTEVMNKTVEKPAPTQAPEAAPKPPARDDEPSLRDAAESLFGFSFNSLLQTAGKKAKNEIARAAEYAMDGAMEHPTIVIDRSDDVELLLRELASAQKELAEERRMHLEDLRLLAELQGSMRLLEVKSSQTSMLKEELLDATRALQDHRRQYQEFLALPWWKRLFKKNP